MDASRDTAECFEAARPPDLPSVRFSGEDAILRSGTGEATVAHLERKDGGLRLSLTPQATVDAVAAVAEALTAGTREGPPLTVTCNEAALRAVLHAEGLIVPEGGAWSIRPELVWQRPSAWLPGEARPAYPTLSVATDGRRHPLRPPKPAGCVYARRIPWLDRVLSFHVLDIQRDLPAFHRWMNDPRVDAIWKEAADRDTHRRSLEERMADPHLLPLIGFIDGEPFGYFELYWASESRLGPHYDAQPYDRGWHVLIGEDAFRGRPYVTAWLPSLMHYMFLDDPRTGRIVGEPLATHAQQIRNLDRAGFLRIRHFDFPHKRALLVMLPRERFFGERLWAPEGAEAGR